MPQTNYITRDTKMQNCITIPELRMPFKQKHSLAGNSYNTVCSRNCYKIQRNTKWVHCECMKNDVKKM
mgnify:CR=1 FL=1